MPKELKMSENEAKQYAEYQKNCSLQAAVAQAGKLEFDLTDATTEREALKRACAEATTLKLGAICVLPYAVKQCAVLLGNNHRTMLVTCISYPHGGDTTKTKIAAIKEAVRDGADEVEVSVPVGRIKDAEWGYVRREFKHIKKAAKKIGLRISLEVDLFSERELEKLCSLITGCGITSIRLAAGTFATSTEPDIISCVKSIVRDKCTIKATGITNYGEMSTALNMGAESVGSKNAAEVARLIISAAQR